MGFVVNGTEIHTDPEGYLAHLDEWNEDIAQALADRDGLALGDQHWQIIRFMRDYFLEYGTAPNLRILQKALKEEFGDEWGDKKFLFNLFPYGPANKPAVTPARPSPPAACKGFSRNHSQ
jgi:sulfur relay protein, TusE/DsrC/DsvC family